MLDLSVMKFKLDKIKYITNGESGIAYKSYNLNRFISYLICNGLICGNINISHISSLIYIEDVIKKFRDNDIISDYEIIDDRINDCVLVIYLNDIKINKGYSMWRKLVNT